MYTQAFDRRCTYPRGEKEEEEGEGEGEGREEKNHGIGHSMVLRKSHDRVATFCCNSQKIKAARGNGIIWTRVHVYIPTHTGEGSAMNNEAIAYSLR